MKKKEIDFFTELKELLEKYNVEIESDDEYQGYPECGQDIQIRFDSRFTFSESKFGRYVDIERIEKHLNTKEKE